MYLTTWYCWIGLMAGVALGQGLGKGAALPGKSQCLPEDSPVDPFSDFVSYYTLTHTLCAIYCRKFKCLFHTFLAGECRLYGTPTEVKSTVSVFNLDPKPPVVTDPFIEIAQGKSYAVEVAEYACCPGLAALDGDPLTYYKSYSKHWLLVDLGAYYIVYKVDMLPFSGLSASFRSVEVRVGAKLITAGLFRHYKLVGSYAGPHVSGNVILENAGGECGRYLVVIISDTAIGPLGLAELKVYARKAEGKKGNRKP